MTPEQEQRMRDSDIKHEPTLMWGCNCGASFKDSDGLWHHLDDHGALPSLFKPVLSPPAPA